MTVLDATKVAYIRAHPEESNSELARMFGVHRNTVRLIRANVLWYDPAYEPQPSPFRGRGRAA